MAAGDGTGNFQDGDGLDPRSKSATDRIGVASKNLGNAAKGLAGNKKALISLGVGGGIIGLILALVLGFAQLKMISMMSTLEKHFYKKNTYTFDQRKNKIMREYFNKYYGPQGDSAIDDSTAPIYRQALKAMHTGNFEKKLNARYEIKIRAGANPASRLVTFKDKQTGEVFDYDTAEKADRRALNTHFDDVISNIFHENGWAKRTLYRYRISSRTGIEWHWLDKINKPYAKAQLYAANQVTAFLLSDRSPASAYASKIIDILLGDEHSDAKQQYTAAAEAGATDQATKIVAKQLVSKINVAGDVVAAVSLFCGINKIFSDDVIQKLVQGKAEVEEMTAYGAWASKADQQKSGNTNATAVSANLSLLTSEKDQQGHTQDISSSNNWYRANGQDVKYQPNDNCSKNSELCNAKTPNQITQGGILGALNSVSNAIDSPFYQVVSATPAGAFLPGGIQATAVCGIYDSVLKSFVNAVLGVVSDALIGGLKLVPGGAEFLSKIGEVTASLTQSVLSLVLPPVVDATTRGPALLNILASGADLSANSMMGSPAGHAPDDDVACKDKSAEEQKQDGSYCLGTLSPSENKQLAAAATQADADKFKLLPTYQKIASIDEPDSVLSRVVAHTPASPSVGIQQSTDTMMAVINPARWGKMLASIPTLLSGPTFAADSAGADGFVTNDRGGKATSQFTDQYGASEDTLKNAPLGDSKLGNTDDWVGCTLVASAENGDPSKMPADCPKDPVQPTPVCPVDGAPTDQGASKLDDAALATIAKKYDLQSADIATLNGDKVASYRATDPPNQPASVLKLIIADALISTKPNLDKKVTFKSSDMYDGNGSDGRNVGEKDTLGNVLTAMVKESSNTDANLIMRELGGVSKVNKIAHALGYNDTTIAANFNGNTTVVKNSTTAHDINTAMISTYSKESDGNDLVREALRHETGPFQDIGSEANKWADVDGSATGKPVTGNSAIFAVKGKKYAVTIYSNKAYSNDNSQGVKDIKSASKDIVSDLGSTSAAGSAKSAYILGDSLTEGDYYENTGPEFLKGLLDKAGIKSTANASSGRAISIAGTDRDKTSGLKAVEDDSAKIKSADTIVIGLGTNVDGTGTPEQYKANVVKLIKAVKNINGSAKIYWVNIFSDGVDKKNDRNKILSDLAGSEGFTVIDADKANIPTADQAHIHPDASGYKKLSKLIADAIQNGGGNADTSNSQCGPSTAGNTAGVDGNAQELAKKILDNKNVEYQYSAKEDLQLTADGKNGTAGVPVDIRLLQIIATLMEKHKVSVSALESHGQGHCNNTPKSGCPNDPHYLGIGLDIALIDGQTAYTKFNDIYPEIKQYLPKGSGIGQIDCGANSPRVPDGLRGFGDACNHLHLDVPKK